VTGIPVSNQLEAASWFGVYAVAALGIALRKSRQLAATRALARRR
jgi:hypothetical protein